MTLDGDRRKGDGTEAQGIKFLQGSAGKWINHCLRDASCSLAFSSVTRCLLPLILCSMSPEPQETALLHVLHSPASSVHGRCGTPDSAKSESTGSCLLTLKKIS